MTDYVRQVVISFEAEDNTAAATASVEANYADAGKAAEEFGNRSEEAHGRNEFATRRTVSALHMLGTAIGGNIGQAVQYAGSVTQIVSATNPWVAGITAATLAIKLISEAIDFFTGGAKKMREEMEAGRKASDAWSESLRQLVLSKQMEAAGWNEVDKKRDELRKESAKIRERELKLEGELLELGKKQNDSFFGPIIQEKMKIIQGELNAERQRQISNEQSLLELAEAQRVINNKKAMEEIVAIDTKIEKERHALTAKGRAAPGGEPAYGEGLPMGLGMMEFGMAESYRQAEIAAEFAMYDRSREIEIDYQSFLADSKAEQFAMEEEWRREDLRSTQEYERAKTAQAQERFSQTKNILGMLNTLADVGIKNDKARQAVKIGLAVADAAMNVTREMAEGFGDLGGHPPWFTTDPWGAAMHFTAAGLFGAIGATKVAGMAGGGGGGSSYDRSTAQGGTAEDRGPQKSEVTIYINGERAGTAGFGKVVVDSIDAHLDRQNPGRQRKQVTP